ncbi:MAG: DUF11 domain-containing protein [Chloroflexota bacterium]|nr:MAG: DUF11 domain-containing protein [Chloroflexota bacterium]
MNKLSSLVLRILTVFVLMASVLSLSVQPSRAAASLNITLTGQIGGETHAVAVAGQYAYIGIGPRLFILDVTTNPANPTVIGKTLPLDDVIEGIFLDAAGGYVYAAAGDGGLSIIQISTPSNPTVSGSYDTAGYAKNVVVQGNLAYVADGFVGLVIVDVSNKAVPVLSNSVDTPGFAEDVDLFTNGGNLNAAVADGSNGLQLVNLSPLGLGLALKDPVNPEYASGIEVDASNTNAYLSDSFNLPYGLRVINISNLFSPSQVGGVTLSGGPEDVAITSNTAFVALGNAGVKAVDITTPASPSALGTYNTAGTADAVAFASNTIYVADSNQGLQILNAANLSSLALAGSYVSIGSVWGAATTAGNAFTANGDLGLGVVDTSLPASLSKMALLDTSGFAEALDIDGDYAYLADGTGGLKVISIATPGAPSQTGVWQNGNPIYDVDFYNGFAFVANGVGGISAVDVTDPAAPSTANSIGNSVLLDTAEGLTVAYHAIDFADYAYVADGGDGMHIIDVSSPGSLIHVTKVPTPPDLAYMTDVAVSGNTAYVAGGPDGLGVINISNPAAPVYLYTQATIPGTLNPFPGNVQGVSVFGKYLLVAAGTGGLYILDATNPSALTLAGYYDTAGSAESVTTAGYIYVSSAGGGLYALDYNFLEADLGITHAAHAATIAAGDLVTYTITVDNVGLTNAPNAVVADTFQPEVSNVTWSCTATPGSVCHTASGSGNINATVDVIYGGRVTFIATGRIRSNTPAGIGMVPNTSTVTLAAGSTDTDTGNNDWTDAVDVIRVSDIQVTQVEQPDPAVTTMAISYTLTVRNLGPSDIDALSGVAVTDTLPAHVENIVTTPSQGTCIVAVNDVTCNLGPILSQGTATIRIDGNLNATTPPGNITNHVEAGSLTTDPVPANNVSDLATLVKQPVDLALFKSSSPEAVFAGEMVTYTLTILNEGLYPAPNVTLVDTLPAAAIFQSASTGCSHVNGVVNCTPGSFAAGGSQDVSIVVKIPSSASANVTNSATVTSDGYETDPADNSDSVITGVSRQANLALSAVSDPDPVAAGAVLTYTLSVNNLGPSDSSGVVVTATLPAQVTFASSADCTATAGSLTCNLGEVTAGATKAAVVKVNVKSNAFGLISGKAGVRAVEPDPSLTNNNVLNIQTDVVRRSDLQISIADGDAEAEPGRTIAYTIVITNAGPSDMTGAIISDTFSTQFTSVSWNCVATAGSVCVTASGTVKINATVNLIAGGKATFTAHAQISATATGSITNTARVTAPAGVTDPDLSNNIAIETTPEPLADLALSYVLSPGQIFIGRDLTYTVIVTNLGPSFARGAAVNATLPAGVSLVSAEGCTQNGNDLTCNIGRLNNGAKATFVVVVRPSSAGAMETTFVVTSLNDPVLGNNTEIVIASVDFFTLFMPVINR